MIDTVCLIIPKSKMIFLDLSDQGVPAWNLQSHTEDYQKFVKNPSLKDRNSGYYFPRLTGYKRRFGQEENIKIEFSAPKLLFKNNLFELKDEDFPAVLEILRTRLYSMGVVVGEDVLSSAKLSSVHFSKNIILSEGYTVSYLISEINKIDLRKSFDFTKARYINDGQSLCAYTAAHELIIYDKIADLAKDKKRAIDKDQTKYQMSLFRNLEKKNKLLEVLRFEIRLAKKQKLNSVLQQLGCNKDPSFKEVFSSELSKRVVTHYWQTLIKERNIGLFTVEMTPKEILRAIYKGFPSIKPNRAIYLTGLFSLAKNGKGIRELRSMLTKTSDERTWYRLTSDLRQISTTISHQRVRDWVSQIDIALKEYKPLNVKNYE